MHSGKEMGKLRWINGASTPGLDSGKIGREQARRFFAATLILLLITTSIFLFSKVKVIEARSLHQGELILLSNHAVLFTDAFDRADGDVVGNA